MSDQMTIEQAEEYLREKLPQNAVYSLTHYKLGVVGGPPKPDVYTVSVMTYAGTEEFTTSKGFSGAVRAAVDWARGQEAGNA